MEEGGKLKKKEKDIVHCVFCYVMGKFNLYRFGAEGMMTYADTHTHIKLTRKLLKK